MKILTFPLLFLFSFSIAQEIEWQNSYGGSSEDVPMSVTPTADGGFIIAGYTTSNDGDITLNKGGADYWVVKVNRLGVLQWQTTLGGSSKHDYANSVIQNSKGEYVIAGSSFSKDGDIKEKKAKGADDFWVVFLKEGGKIKRSRNLGGFKKDIAYSIKQTRDEEYIVTGSTESNDQDVKGNHGKSDVWLAKLKKNGKLRWQQTFGGSQSETGYDVVQTGDGGFLVVGESNSSDGNVSGNKGSYDFWVIKTTPNGKPEWQKSLGGSENDVARAVVRTSDGGYIVAGETMSSNGDVKMNNGAVDVWVVKLSASGSLVWEKNYGGSSFDYATDIIQSPSGGYLIIGSTNSTDGDVKSNSHGSTNTWIIKINEVGSLKWEKVIGGNGIDEGMAAAAIRNESFVVVSASDSRDGNLSPEQAKGGTDFWLAKMIDYSASGPGGTVATRKKEEARGIYTTGNGYITVGYTLNEGQKDILVKKYDVGGFELWTKTYGGSGDDVANGVVVTTDGKILITGESSSSDGDFEDNHGKNDYFLMELDSDGEKEWVKMYGGTLEDKAQKIIAAKNNKYLIVGSSQSNNGDVSGGHGNYDVWVIQVNDDGELEWEQTYGGSNVDMGFDITPYRDSLYAIAGYTMSSGSGDVAENAGITDYWVLKINDKGKLKWQKTFGGSKSDIGAGIVATEDKGLVVVGSSASSDGLVGKNNGGKDFWIYKIDSAENIAWNRHYGGSNDDEAFSIAPAPDGGFYIAGNTASADKDIAQTYGLQDGWLIKTDANGKMQWQASFGEGYNDAINTVAVTADGLIVLSGYSSFDRNNQEFYVTEYEDVE